MKDKIIQMLGNGIPATVVARACGVTDGYVSQLMADENIRAEVIEAKVKNVEKGLKADTLIESIELQSLEKLEKLLPFTSTPRDVLAIFTVMNAAKKKTNELSGTGQGPTAPLVQINISQAAAVQFKMDSVQQVVEVDGRSMATLPGKNLQAILGERIANRPAISDSTTASALLDKIELGIPEDSLANEL